MKILKWIALKLLIIVVIMALLIKFDIVKKETLFFWTNKTIDWASDYLSKNWDDIKKGIKDWLEKAVDETGKIMDDPKWAIDNLSDTIATMTTNKLWETNIKSFNRAKKVLERNIYNGKHETFYCGCEFEWDKVNQTSCWYSSSSKKMESRWKTIEWEHIVPAEKFGKNFKAWTKGDESCVDKKWKSFKGRKCAEKVEKTFNEMEANLFNLVPAVWEVNGLRSNFDPVEKVVWNPYYPKFWKCDIKIYSKDKIFIPRDEIKGNIARAYLYMNNKYPTYVKLSQEEKDMFIKWDKQDPIDEKECKEYKVKSKLMNETISIFEESCS